MVSHMNSRLLRKWETMRTLAPISSQPRKDGTQRTEHPGLRKVTSLGPETPDRLFAAWPDVSLESLKVTSRNVCLQRARR